MGEGYYRILYFMLNINNFIFIRRLTNSSNGKATTAFNACIRLPCATYYVIHCKQPEKRQRSPTADTASLSLEQKAVSPARFWSIRTTSSRATATRRTRVHGRGATRVQRANRAMVGGGASSLTNNGLSPFQYTRSHILWEGVAVNAPVPGTDCLGAEGRGSAAYRVSGVISDAAGTCMRNCVISLQTHTWSVNVFRIFSFVPSPLHVAKSIAVRTLLSPLL